MLCHRWILRFRQGQDGTTKMTGSLHESFGGRIPLEKMVGMGGMDPTTKMVGMVGFHLKKGGPFLPQ